MSSTLPDFVSELLDKIAHENGFNQFSIGIDCDSLFAVGFTSSIFSIKIVENGVGSKRLELVCKVAPSDEEQRKEFSSHVFFRQEAFFYQHCMPTLAKFQEEKHLPTSDQFRSYPKCYGAIIDDEKQRYAIVLEDLRTSNFKMWDKRKTAPIENARINMRELGKFHGLSMAMKDQKPIEFNAIKRWEHGHIEFVKSKSVACMCANNYDKAIASLQNDDHKDIVRHFKSDVLESFSNCLGENAVGRFDVLCHGK